MECFALYRPQYGVNAALATGQVAGPKGLSPQQIQAAYKLPAGRQSRQTVAVSIAFDAPHLAQYLAVYRRHYHLPTCTIASGCLRIVNQHGTASPLPASGVPSGWALEETLDVSMISAACPHCHILVVEGNSPSPADLGATENTAARLGAQVISNSYGQRENGAVLATAADYTHPGHTIVVASGDFGYSAANFPADLTDVTAAAGTQLTRAPHTRRGWTEQVLDQPAAFLAGSSGCSAYVVKPAWQHDPNCPGRTVADVSAVGWNVPIYDKDFARRGKHYVLSPEFRTVWTWRSRPEPAATVPTSWFCGFTATGADQHCAVQPMSRGAAGGFCPLAAPFGQGST